MRKRIKDLEFLYEVDENGNVYSLPKIKKTPNGLNYYTKEVQLKPYKNHKGYLIVDLRNETKRKCKPVHKLVAEVFIPNIDNKPQVNHKNGIKTDNRVENLEWTTNSENQKHAFAMGLQKGNFKHPNSKLTYDEVQYIKTHYIKGKIGCGMKSLANKFGVSYGTIQQIIYGKSYKNIK